jgi:HTH-type transcriptional regulator / antitoxin HigA
LGELKIIQSQFINNEPNEIIKEMETLKFTIIKSKEQYNKYCEILEDLVTHEDQSTHDEIELLTLLIEKWDVEHNSLND